MESVSIFINNYIAEILIAVLLLSLLSFFLAVLNISRTNILLRRYRKLMRGMNNKNLEAVLFNQLEAIEANQERLKEMESSFAAINSKLTRSIQRVGIVRYDAFDQNGSQQSFSIAMLNNKGDGFVLTSLYGRSSSTIFAKPVKKKESEYPLTKEEKEAIEQALYGL